MENLPGGLENASSEENAEDKKLPDQEVKEDLVKKELKVDRKHDFTHTHPDHAKHKNFGFDHEPGSF